MSSVHAASLDSAQSIEAAEADPASLAPALRRDADELDGFLDFLAAEIAHPGLAELWRRAEDAWGYLRSNSAKTAQARSRAPMPLSATPSLSKASGALAAHIPLPRATPVRMGPA